jgi:hypothetical protein
MVVGAAPEVVVIGYSFTYVSLICLGSLVHAQTNPTIAMAMSYNGCHSGTYVVKLSG